MVTSNKASEELPSGTSFWWHFLILHLIRFESLTVKTESDDSEGPLIACVLCNWKCMISLLQQPSRANSHTMSFYDFMRGERDYWQFKDEINKVSKCKTGITMESFFSTTKHGLIKVDSLWKRQACMPKG